MAQRIIEFDAQSLLHLLIHYTQDHDCEIPLDGTLTGAGVSQFIPRWVMLEVASDKWDGIRFVPGADEPYPLHVRYEGKRVMSWGNDGEQHTKDTWKESVETPKIQ